MVEWCFSSDDDDNDELVFLLLLAVVVSLDIIDNCLCKQHAFIFIRIHVRVLENETFSLLGSLYYYYF